MRFWAVAVAVGMAGWAFAQADTVGPRQFPQFRNMSGLPGSGFPIGPKGVISMRGAMAYSTPVAYSLRGWQAVIGGTNLSNSMRLRWFNGSGRSSSTDTGNATAQLMVGVPIGEYGALTSSVMLLSSLGDNAFNFHYELPPLAEGWTFAVGVQDLSGNGGTSGEGIPGDTDWARSYYGVATYQFPGDIYASLGVGSNRFEGVFGNISAPVAPWARGFVEYDRFNWNAGVGVRLWDLGRGIADGRPSLGVLTLGAVRGKYAFFALNVSF